LKDELIRDKILLGIARERGLTLVTAIEMSRTAEVTEMRAIEIETPHTEADTDHAVARQTFRQNQLR
jgi:hypothetical protein